MKRLLAISGVIYIAVGATLAAGRSVTSEEIAKCTSENGAQVRLLCYDQLFRGNAAPSFSYEGSWKISENTDPIDDTQTVLAALPSKDRTYILVFRCKRREVMAFVVRGQPWSGGSSAKVILRRDKELPATSYWNIAPDRRTAVAPPTLSMTKWALDAGNLVIRAEVDGIEDTAVFDLGDTTPVRSRLKAACPIEFL